jgi:choline dehydrogenase-like flavoprotein
MIKLANTEIGSVGVHRVRKALSTRDRSRLSEAVALCRAILVAAEAAPREVFVDTLNAGHPGGMMPLDAASANTLHHRSLPDNVYVVDGSLLPRSLGMPPILTIMALSLRVAAACRNRLNV